MGAKWDVMARTGEYTDKDGQTKARWQKCGVVLESDKGLSLKIEVIPVGEWNGWFSLFEPKPREERAAAPKRKADPFDDSDPFR